MLSRSYVARMLLTLICLASSDEGWFFNLCFVSLFVICINLQLLLQSLFCLTFCNLQTVIPYYVNSIKIWVCSKLTVLLLCNIPLFRQNNTLEMSGLVFAVIPILAVKVVLVNKIQSCKLFSNALITKSVVWKIYVIEFW